MASRYKYTTKELQTKPVTEIPIEDLRTATRQLLDVANKRYARGEKSWGDDFMQTGFNPGQSVKGKSASELRKIYRQSQRFLESKISTEKGRKEIVQSFKKGIRYKGELTKEQYLKMTKAYSKYEEIRHTGSDKIPVMPYRTVFETAIEIVKDHPFMGVDEILDTLISDMNKKDEEEKENMKKEENLNDFLRAHPELSAHYNEIHRMGFDQIKLFLRGLGYNPDEFDF